MQQVIVSGANSFIGSAVVKALLKRNVNVIALCRLGRTSNLPTHRNLSVLSFDMTQPEQLSLPKGHYDAFYHFSWVGGTAVDHRGDYALQLKNAEWTLEMLKKAKAIGCRKFIAAGSIMEKESILASCKSGNRPGMGYIYGAGKLAAHLMAQSLAANLDIPLIWAQITNAYGVGEISTRMVNTTIRKCIRGEAPEFTSAVQNYDFIYIDDVAEAFCCLGEKGKPFTEYTIGSGRPRPLKEFLLEMKDAIAPDLPFHFGNIPYTGVSMPLELLDTETLEADTGFKAKVSFAEGTRRTRDWLEQEIRHD